MKPNTDWNMLDEWYVEGQINKTSDSVNKCSDWWNGLSPNVQMALLQDRLTAVLELEKSLQSAIRKRIKSV